MDREDIIRMAREAGLADSNGVVHAFYQLEYFAYLVAEHEREQCARVCDAANKSTHPADLADAIRARGQNP